MAGIEYKSCCYRIQIVQRRYLTSHTANGGLDTSIALQLELTGLSSVGKPADAFLQKEISGYTSRRPECRECPVAPDVRIRQPNLPENNRFMRKIVAIFTCSLVACMAALLLSGPAVRAQTRDIGVHGEMLDRIAAIVNDGLVLKSELDTQMDAVTKRLQEQKVELPSQSVLKQQVLDRLILQEIESQRAKRVGLTISDEQLNGALQELPSATRSPSINCQPRSKPKASITSSTRESMRKELTLSTLRQRDVIAHINVTPHEMEQFLTRQQSSAANDEFNVSHILLSPAGGRHPRNSWTRSPRRPRTSLRVRQKARISASLAIANSNSQTALDGGQLRLAQGDPAA